MKKRKWEWKNMSMSLELSITDCESDNDTTNGLNVSFGQHPKWAEDSILNHIELKEKIYDWPFYNTLWHIFCDYKVISNK